MQIEYPSLEQKEHSITLIKMHTKRRRISTLRFLADSYKEIGVSVILRRSYHVYSLSILIFAILFLYMSVIVNSAFEEMHNFTTILFLFFAISPFVLLLTDGLYQLQERPSDTYDLQNVHKYASRHLILLRMPLFALGAIGIDFVLAFVWCFHLGFEYLLPIVAVTASSVLLYSYINLVMFLWFRGKGWIGSVLLWVTGNICIYYMDDSIKTFLFSSVPAVIHMAAALLIAAVFFRTVRMAYQSPLCKVTQ